MSLVMDTVRVDHILQHDVQMYSIIIDNTCADFHLMLMQHSGATY